MRQDARITHCIYSIMIRMKSTFLANEYFFQPVRFYKPEDPKSEGSTKRLAQGLGAGVTALYEPIVLRWCTNDGNGFRQHLLVGCVRMQVHRRHEARLGRMRMYLDCIRKMRNIDRA